MLEVYLFFVRIGGLAGFGSADRFGSSVPVDK